MSLAVFSYLTYFGVPVYEYAYGIRITILTMPEEYKVLILADKVAGLFLLVS